MRTQLLKDWREITLGDAFVFEKKSTIKAGEGNGSGKYKFFTSSDTQSKFINKAIFDGEYLIFSTGGQAGVHYCNEKFSTSTDCFVVKVDEIINVKYVYYFLRANIQILEAGFKGAGLKHISKEYIKKLNVVYPADKSTQKKIVSILEKAEKLKELRNEADGLTKDFLNAVFLEMFGEYEDTEPLGNHLSFLTSGSRGWAKYYSKSGDLFLRIENVGKNQLNIENVTFVIAPDTKEAKRTVVRPGDVLLSITADLGRTCVIPSNFPRAFINQHLAILRLDEYLDPLFVAQYLTSNKGLSQISRLNTGGTKAGLNFKDIRSIKIPIPTLKLQKTFANIIHQVEQLKKHQIDSKEHIDNLFGLLSQKSFKGELAC